METKAKKKKMNLIMVMLIAVIVFCGIMAVGSIKGWFGGSDSPLEVESTIGTASIERSGVAYSLEKGTLLESEDIIETVNGSEAAISLNKNNLLEMSENSTLCIGNCEADDISMELEQGELFADIPQSPENFEISFGENTAKITGTVFSISVQHGSAALNVYAGSVEVTAGDGSDNVVETGSSISIVQSEDGKFTAEVKKFELTSLSNFVISGLLDYDNEDELCFSQKEINKIAEDRNTENSKAANGSSDVIVSTSGSSSGGSSDSSSGSSSGSHSSSKSVNKCTITIKCDTILDNMDNLASGKDKYVPSNGVILSASTVEFKDGETVFDVLKRACSYAGIPLEYSYTPLYESYYIEGINHLYEFDCGSESGWMYKVNGWFPNYGCSSYTLKNGDNIVWSYTCNGLGADVGGNIY